MKLTEKFVLAMALVVTLAVSVGGTILLAVQFQASFQNAVAQGTSRHILARYALESKVLADRLKGVAFSKANLAKYADQLCSYTADERMRVTDSNGQVVFSNLKDSPPLAEDSYQACRTGEQYLLYFQSATSVGGNRFRLVSAYDITHLYRERQRQFWVFLGIQGVVLAGTMLAAWRISRAITKPLRVLGQVSREIAAGDYDRRTGLDTGDEIGTFSQNFDRMVDALQREIEHRSAFVADFSHELKTPMTSLIGYADLLRTRQLSEDEKFRYANAIYKNGKRLETLSTRMLSLLHLSSTPLELTPVDVPKLGKRLGQLFSAGTLTVELEPAQVRGEAELLLTLLRNLVENGQKASENAPVTVTGVRDGERYRFSVIDQGSGMTAEQVQRATEPFYKGDRSRSSGGFGIGLSLCQRICQRHGTVLEFESEPSVGTTVSFWLEVCNG